MSDSFTEVTHEGYFARIKNAIVGVAIGCLMFIGACILLFWNEGRAVTRWQALEEGASSVQTVAVDSVDDTKNGKLVHCSGKAITDETLRDSTFGVSLVALRLQRSVEMYQWKQSSKTKTVKKLGGGKKKTTTYSYSEVWSSSLISSSSFKRSGHENPSSKPFRDDQWTAKNVTMGAFSLPSQLVGKIDAWHSVELPPKSGFTIADGMYYNASPASPRVGDVRITIRAVQPCDVSLVAKQSGSSFASYLTKNGQDITDLRLGTLTAEQMFAAMKEEATLMTWLIRLGGFLLMLFGIMLVFNPISVFADVIPFLGDILGFGLFIFAVALAIPLTLLIIALGWFAYRPFLSVALIAAGIGAFVFIKRSVGGKKAAVSAPAMASGPPPIPGS